MGFPPQFFTVLFAVPRVTGYLSHWREQLSDPDVKIARPQQNYTVCLPFLLTLSGLWRTGEHVLCLQNWRLGRSHFRSCKHSSSSALYCFSM